MIWSYNKRKGKYILKGRNKINECNYDQNKGNISKILGLRNNAN